MNRLSAALRTHSTQLVSTHSTPFLTYEIESVRVESCRPARPHYYHLSQLSPQNHGRHSVAATHSSTVDYQLCIAPFAVANHLGILFAKPSTMAAALSDNNSSGTQAPPPPPPTPPTDEASFCGAFFACTGPPRLLVLALLLSLGIGSIVSIVPGVVSDRFARLSHHYDGAPCSTFDRNDMPLECVLGGEDAQRFAAEANLAKNVLILLFASIIGSMSDCRGRKSFLALSFVLSSLAPVVLALMQCIANIHPIWYYASDCSNGLISGLTLMLTMLSDCLPPTFRAAGYGLFLACFLSGFALSQALALALSHVGVSIASAFLLLSGCFFTLCFVPETLSEETKTKALEKQSEEEGGLLRMIIRPVTELKILNRNRFFRLLAFVSFCSAFIYSSDQTLVVYYMEEHLAVHDEMVAYMLGAMSLLGVLVQVFLLNRVITFLGEKKTLILGFLLGTCHNVIYGIANSQSTIFAGLLLSEFTSLTYPVIIAMRSFNVGEEEQGHVQGAFFALASIANALGPACLQAIYDRTKHLPYPGPGLMFLFAAFVYFTGCVVACLLPAEKANCSYLSEEEAVRSQGEDGDEEAHEILSDSSTLESQREPLLGAAERHSST